MSCACPQGGKGGPSSLTSTAGVEGWAGYKWSLGRPTVVYLPVMLRIAYCTNRPPSLMRQSGVADNKTSAMRPQKLVE